MNRIGLVTLSHSNADLLLRQKISLDEKEKEQFIILLKEKYNLKGLLLLFTCNRAEIYFEGKISTYKLILELCRIKGIIEEFHRYLFLFEPHEDVTAIVSHLSRVALGLKSSVWGDPEVIGQLKNAYRLSLSHGLQGTRLERIMQTVFRINKQVTGVTDFRKHSESWSYLCLKLLKTQTDIADKKLLLLGAGNLTRDIIKYLPRFSFAGIALANRTDEKARLLAENYQLDFIEWHKINPELIHSFDLVIFATAANQPLLRADNKQKNQTEKIWIDLGMPANVEKNHCDSFNGNLKIFNLDYFSNLISEHRKNKFQQLSQIETIINTNIEKLSCWIQNFNARKMHTDQQEMDLCITTGSK